MASKGSCSSLKWPGQQVMIRPCAPIVQDDVPSGGFFESHLLHGAQSLGYDANFDIENIRQLGCAENYDSNEGLPQVSITTNKVLDGHCPAYILATWDAEEPNLLARAECKSDIAVAYFDCTQESACGDPKCIKVFPEVQVSSFGYTFGTDGAFTEDVSFVGNNIIAYQEDMAMDEQCGCAYTDEFMMQLSAIGEIKGADCCDHNPLKRVSFKEHFLWDVTDETGAVLDVSGIADAPKDENGAVCLADTSVLPNQIAGIGCDGTNADEEVCIQSISVSTDLNREEIFCLGKRGPKDRSITLPVDVNTSIEVVADCPPPVSATEDGVFVEKNLETGCESPEGCKNIGFNLNNGTIRLVTCDGLRIYLGTKNKLSGYSISGGDTSGSNLSVSYNFTNENKFTVIHCCEAGNMMNHPDGSSGEVDVWDMRNLWLTDCVEETP